MKITNLQFRRRREKRSKVRRLPGEAGFSFPSRREAVRTGERDQVTTAEEATDDEFQAVLMRELLRTILKHHDLILKILNDNHLNRQ